MGSPEPDDTTDSREPDVYQVPLSTNEASVIRQNYKTTVLSDLSATAIESILDTTLSRDRVRVWGNKGSVRENEGDLLLFGDRGTQEYLTVATIDQSFELDGEQATEFAEAVGWEGDAEEYTHVMILATVYEAELKAKRFWDQLGYSNFPQDSFSRINFDRSGSEFSDSYDSVKEFIEAIQGRQLYPVEADPELKPATEPRRGAEIARQLDVAQQLVFHGPPGTGKTYLAQQFARWWLTGETAGTPTEDQLELVTFHPSFSYEDFVEGLTTTREA